MTKEKELTLHQKLVKIQSELKVAKDKKNTFGNFEYRHCEDILKAVKPLLLEYNLTLIIDDEPIIIGDRYYIKSVAEIRDEKSEISTTAYAREPEIKPKMDESQTTGSTSYYARKYALNGLFCLDDSKDSDDKNKDTISEEQFKILTKLIDDANQDIKALCDHYKIKSVKELPEDDFKGLKKILENKIKNKNANN